MYVFWGVGDYRLLELIGYDRNTKSGYFPVRFGELCRSENRHIKLKVSSCMVVSLGKFEINVIEGVRSKSDGKDSIHARFS